MKKLSVANYHSKFYKSENFSKKLIHDLFEYKEEVKERHSKKKEEIKDIQKNKETLFSKNKIDPEKHNSKEKNVSVPKTQENIGNHKEDQEKKKIKNSKTDKKIKNKQKIINEKLDMIIMHNGIISSKEPAFIPNYVFNTPSEPASKHKFRSIEKDKWVAHSNFKV